MRRDTLPVTTRAVLALSIAIATALTACERAATAPAPARQTEWPQIDKSTPDNALRSYWATRDALRMQAERAIADNASNWLRARPKVELVMTTPIARGYVDGEGIRVFETFSRDILEVKVESDSRAVAITQIKNITPIPSGAEMSKYDEERRGEGERYKYVLLKNADGWRIDEIWEWERYPTPNWRKSRPGDGKPRVPTLTYEGM